MKRRGAALILALAALALTGSFLAACGVRAFGMKAAQLRAERQARLHIALWDAAWSRLQAAASNPGGVPESAEREAPDGVATSVRVERMEGKNGPVRFSLALSARKDRDRRDAWALVQRDSEEFRFLAWVER